MDVRVITTDDEFAALEPAWRAWEDGVAALPHQMSFEYVSAWVRARGDARLHMVVAEDHHELVGVLPTAIQQRSVGPARWQELAFVTEGDHRDILVDGRRVSPSTTIRTLIGAAPGAQQGIRRTSLRYLPSRSPLVHHMLRSAELNSTVRTLVEIPRVELKTFAGFASYRRTVTRSALTSLNKLRRDLGLEVTEVSPVPPALYTELVELHRRERRVLVEQHGRRDRRSLFDDPRRAAAYRSLVVGSPHASAFVARTKAGELAFYELAWRRGRCVWAWNTAYEPALAKHRPSRARIAMLEQLFERGDTDVYDLGAGRYPWKFELTSTFSVTYEATRWTGDDRLARVLRGIRP